MYGPALLAHALPNGAFSLSDAVGAAFAKRDCPAPPEPVLAAERSRPDFVDLARSAKHVVCARLWGTEPRVIQAETADKCRQLESCPACDDRALLDRWAELSPPLQLGAAAR